jgi:hypothetical protein
MPGDGVGLLPPRLPGMFQVAKPGFLLGSTLMSGSPDAIKSCFGVSP